MYPEPDVTLYSSIYQLQLNLKQFELLSSLLCRVTMDTGVLVYHKVSGKDTVYQSVADSVVLMLHTQRPCCCAVE